MTLFFEAEARRSGYRLIAGLDEAGRGPLAGPVVAAAVVLPEGCRIRDLTDSKQLTPLKRERLFKEIQEQAVCLAVGISDTGVIERINILEATRRAMEKAVMALDPVPDYLLIDAIGIRSLIPQLGIVKGDLLSHSISAASVIAKVTRDRIMEEYHEVYPVYNFRRHKGYGTPEHLMKIRTFGPSPIHRKTFRGVREYCTGLE
ncbi:MAG: ribonuclease HII [bacterium]